MNNLENAYNRLIELLEEKGYILTKNELTDFGLTGNETNQQLAEMVSDYHNECQTEKAAEKQAWRYEL